MINAHFNFCQSTLLLLDDKKRIKQQFFSSEKIGFADFSVATLTGTCNLISLFFHYAPLRLVVFLDIVGLSYNLRPDNFAAFFPRLRVKSFSHWRFL